MQRRVLVFVIPRERAPGGPPEPAREITVEAPTVDELLAAAREAERRLQAILKAVVVGARTQDPASRPGGEDLAAAFASAGALEPPYDPEALCLLMEHSNSLRQNAVPLRRRPGPSLHPAPADRAPVRRPGSRPSEPPGACHRGGGARVLPWRRGPGRRRLDA